MNDLSQTARILDALADGEWHTTEEIHRAAGFSRLNSRVSELRTRGHMSLTEKVPGERGVRGHRYRLLDGLDGGSALPRVWAVEVVEQPSGQLGFALDETQEISDGVTAAPGSDGALRLVERATRPSPSTDGRGALDLGGAAA